MKPETIALLGSFLFVLGVAAYAVTHKPLAMSTSDLEAALVGGLK